MKVFRRMHAGPNPDVEVPQALHRVGWKHVAPTIAVWTWNDYDLAVVRQFLTVGTDGWLLALTSLRDVYDRREHPAASAATSRPRRPGWAPSPPRCTSPWRRRSGPSRVIPGRGPSRSASSSGGMTDDRVDDHAVKAVYERLAEIDPSDAGVSMRIHGDYHLGQIMRTDEGWVVLDFEGEPALPLELRRAPSSPLRDVAGMARSFHYATQVGLAERGEDADEEMEELARLWEERNMKAFLDGYDSVEEVRDLLPSGDETRRLVLNAFIVAKTVYEVAYETSHRPDWASIPLAGLARQLQGTSSAGDAWVRAEEPE